MDLRAPDRSKCGPCAAVVHGVVKIHVTLDGGDPRITLGTPCHIKVISNVLMGRSAVLIDEDQLGYGSFILVKNRWTSVSTHNGLGVLVCRTIGVLQQ